MAQSPRDIVTAALRLERPERLPRDLWTLPWAEQRHPAALRDMRRRFPSDFISPPSVYRPSSRVQGTPYAAGTFVDEWGCTFVNIQEGVIGEVREPILTDTANLTALQPPYETLPLDAGTARDAVNRFCAGTDLYVRGGCCPRPWERYQFLRGTMAAMMDVMQPTDGVTDLLRQIHEFHLRELEFWVTTDIDGINYMDDWGAQDQLLIPPTVWREWFRPLYRDYCDLAHAHGKQVFMHSDGHIIEIYPDLIDVGVDALNSQLFCMDLEEVADCARGRITFWGEIDRQHVLTNPDPEVGRQAVRRVAKELYDPQGGLIVQFEFGAAAQPDTAMAIFEEWEAVDLASRGTRV